MIVKAVMMTEQLLFFVSNVKNATWLQKKLPKDLAVNNFFVTFASSEMTK
jgi:hypothetical protein